MAAKAAADANRRFPAHYAAARGRVDCLRALHAESLSAKDAGGRTPAHHAASHGHANCLRVLHELGAAVSLSAATAEGYTPAHDSAANGHVKCLRELHALGAAASLSMVSADGNTPAYIAAFRGHANCLRELHVLGAAASFTVVSADGTNPAHMAATRGHVNCLRALHELGAAASLSAADAGGRTPAHIAAMQGHVNCLRELHALGAAASLSAADAGGLTPAHMAAVRGKADCLRVLHELGAAASLSAANAAGKTPALHAAAGGHVDCLRVLHAALTSCITPLLAQLIEFTSPDAAGLPGIIAELEAMRSLSWSQGATPAEAAAICGHESCLEFLASIGGAARFWADLVESPEEIQSYYKVDLISKPSLLNLPAKRAWLHERLKAVVGDADAEALSLVARHDNITDGLCAQLGVDETTGGLLDGTVPQRLDVTYKGGGAGGDGLRRTWLSEVTKEMGDRDFGLFCATGEQTLQPNPNSAAYQSDHLAHFALLGRIAGLALYHQEPLNFPFSPAFLYVAFGYEIAFDDLATFAPDVYSSLKKLLAMSADELETMCLFAHLMGYTGENLPSEQPFTVTRAVAGRLNGVNLLQPALFAGV